MATADLRSRARAGDGNAFRELAGPYRRELQVHCYRMLGSFADAEDALQDTLLAAWQGIGGFTEGRASLRTWLYRIATNRCLNARRSASRRPARGSSPRGFTRRGPGKPPEVTDAELVCLAVAQVMLRKDEKAPGTSRTGCGSRPRRSFGR